MILNFSTPFAYKNKTHTFPRPSSYIIYRNINTICCFCSISTFITKAVDRHTGFSVFVFNDTNIEPPNGSKVFTHNTATCPQNVMNVTVNRVTTGVAIFNSNNANLKQFCGGYDTLFASIELCEVYVMGMYY